MKAPLAQSQYGLYVECAEHPGEAYYNLPYLYVLDGSLDAERLCRAVETAVQAHPTLFTHIELNEDGEPVQVIRDQPETFNLQVEDVTDNLKIKKVKKCILLFFIIKVYNFEIIIL